MSFWSKITGKKKGEIPKFDAPPPPPRKKESEPNAYNSVWTLSFDGEKNVGDIGPIKKYVADYSSLRARSWQMFLDSEICQLVCRRFATWVVGEGLKLKLEPVLEVLKSEGIELTKQEVKEFTTLAEMRFKVWSNDFMSDYADMTTFQKQLEEIFINSIVAGDVLVIQRVIDKTLKIQMVDSDHVSTPFGCGYNGYDYLSQEGNRIRHGVEIDSKGQHIAYHVKISPFKWERIPARNKLGNRTAFMVYGLKYRIGEVRGIPLITAVMETASKLERYKEATLGSAEEAAKLAFAIEHGAISTGENPFDNQMAESIGLNHFASGDNPVDVNEKKLLANVAATANKQAVNLPNGAKLSAVESKKEINFDNFYGKNSEVVFATIGIPPEVAMMLYTNNFSSSRAAIKDWEHTLIVKRDYLSIQSINPVFSYWLDVEILKNKIIAPKYLKAMLEKNKMAMAAYKFSRFVGANVPHIDPNKEVLAVRSKLGGLGKNLPLMTLEEAIEALGGGDVDSVLLYFAEELKKAESLNIQAVQPKEDNSQNA